MLLFQIEVNKTYGLQSWRADLKKVLRKAGAEAQPVVFLFNDLQIKDEAFLEDLSMVLSTGEVNTDIYYLYYHCHIISLKKLNVFKCIRFQICLLLRRRPTS